MIAFRNADTDHSGPHFDPWANYNHQKASQSQPRDTAGPTEARFQEHAARLQDHNEKLTKMQMHAAIATVKTELESSFQHAINQQSHQLNSTLGELRQLLQAKPKRNRAADDDDMSG